MSYTYACTQPVVFSHTLWYHLYSVVPNFLCVSNECANNVLSCLSFSVKRERGWRTFKRPGVDAFLEHMSKLYEVVVYSDQPPMVSWSFSFAFGLLCNGLTCMDILLVCSMLNLCLRGWTQGVPFHTGYQDLQLSMWMENITGYADSKDLPNFSALGIMMHSLTLFYTLAPEYCHPLYLYYYY